MKPAYKLDPAQHAEALRFDAPALMPILQAEELALKAQLFGVADADAVASRWRFRICAWVANFGVAAATFLGAAALAVQNGDWAWAAPALGLLGGAAGFAATVALNYLGSGALMKSWLTARAKAESRRLEFFRKLVELARDKDTNTQVKCLDYMKEYYLNDWIDYYHDRSDKHGKSGRRWLLIGSIAAALGTAGVMTGGLVAPVWVLAGVLGTTVASFVTTQETLGQNLRNADRYRQTWENLIDMRGRLVQVGGKVQAGDTTALETWVEELCEHLIQEHREWLTQGESAQSTLTQLQEKLRAPTPPAAQG
ncbi:hypothetical protein [Asticcacaulis sp.]|uniref:hypothetical protein n=1 Tax=Asticcacaulis sp. TaxID=1872648 RepID=UPI00261940E3|nr:hypothetical protein [Asticcacaulis sp.]